MIKQFKIFENGDNSIKIYVSEVSTGYGDITEQNIIYAGVSFEKAKETILNYKFNF